MENQYITIVNEGKFVSMVIDPCGHFIRAYYGSMDGENLAHYPWTHTTKIADALNHVARPAGSVRLNKAP